MRQFITLWILLILVAPLVMLSASTQPAGAEDYNPVPFLVAANNSPQAVKNAAMYVADGNADQVEIQAAIAAAAPGTVLLGEGTYWLTGTINMADGVTLEGRGAGSVLTVGNDKNVNAIISISGVGDTVVRGLKIDGRKAQQSGGAGNGIVVASGAPNTVLEDLTIINTYGKGLSLYGTGSSVRVMNNFIDDAGEKGIYTGQLNTIISGNTVADSNDSGIWLSQANGAVVSDNVVRNNGRVGIELVQSSNVVVSGNLVRSNAALGIHVFSSQSVIVADNRITNNLSNGIDCNGSTNVSLTGNVSSFNGSASLEGNGILVYRCKHVTVTGNVTFSNGQGQSLNRDGIRISDDGSLTARHIVVTGNRSFDNQGTKTQGYGININNEDAAVNFVTIQTNDVMDNGLGGISTEGLVDSPTVIIKDNLGSTVSLP